MPQSDAHAPARIRTSNLILGGGAAGFFAAIQCARELAAAGFVATADSALVTLIEGARAPLTKVRISGGGRCNVTHACFDARTLAARYPRGARELTGPFQRFQPRDTMAWFEAEGVPLKIEADGRVFPTSDDSASSAEALLAAARRAGVKLYCGDPSIDLKRDESDAGFVARLRSGAVYVAPRVLIATGGGPIGPRFAAALGHRIVPPAPSLFSFKINDPELHALAGVAVETARIALPELRLREEGPLLVTHQGLSGPAVLRLSAHGARDLFVANYNADVEIDFLPELPEDAVRAALEEERRANGARSLQNGPIGKLPKRLWRYLLARAGADPERKFAALTRADSAALLAALKHARFRISGKGEFKDEFVTAGGVALEEIDFVRFASRRCSGLYIAGEALDIDGLTGGYNFQAAWTGGWLAGGAMAQASLKSD
jgi:hypothetical protein